MQFKVPQNIDMADKIFGPLTLAQFLYLLVGGMTDYILLQTVFPTQPAIFFLLAVPIALLALASAFIKINDIPFPRFIQAVLLYLSAPKRRIWEKSMAADHSIRTPTVKKSDKPKAMKSAIDKSEIEKMAAVLDTAGWAAVRDAKLKEFVEGFEAAHHTVTATPSSNVKAQMSNQAQSSNVKR